ncbi:MAG: dihydroorotase [Candidatus Neomarinimicrobiota bacterium]|nr:dihydroorotase [Candidatus Neomarinimicrobiota bacterium]
MKGETLPKLFLIKNGDIVDPANGERFNGSILLKNGKIEKIGKRISAPEAEVYDTGGKVVTHGFCDLHVHFREPGREDKETLATGADAALAGGFTQVCAMPNTDPPLDTPESIRFVVEKGSDLSVKIHPIGAISVGQHGKELTELGAMVKEGAVAFSDDGIPVMESGLMRRVLEYTTLLRVPVINHAEDLTLKLDGQMHEGSWSTRLGLGGIPDVSESIMVNRDLELTAMTGGRLHVPHVSSAKSVEWIRAAKEGGLDVTAEVTPHHLFFNDGNLHSYDTNFKVAPPIRTEEDRVALREALKDGTIDCIATDHAPHTIEEKEAPFDWAPCGMIGLESAFGAAWKVLSEAEMELEQVIAALTVNPRLAMGFDENLFSNGREAEITIIDPDEEWVFAAQHLCSKSRNTPFIDHSLKGRVKATISSGRLFEQ